MPRDGSVGEKVYTDVTTLEKAGTPRQEAFNKVAEETGSKPGTVSANYYRVARGKSNGRKPAPRRAPASHPAPPKAASPTSQLAECIQRMVDEAVDARFQRLLG